MANNYSKKHKEKLRNKAQDIKIFPMEKKEKRVSINVNVVQQHFLILVQ